jgi:hypothetical protein
MLSHSILQNFGRKLALHEDSGDPGKINIGSSTATSVLKIAQPVVAISNPMEPR